jgi:hypothetical protein
MVKNALPKGWIAPDGAIRGQVERNDCSGRDSTTRCSRHVVDRAYLAR